MISLITVLSSPGSCHVLSRSCQPQTYMIFQGRDSSPKVLAMVVSRCRSGLIRNGNSLNEKYRICVGWFNIRGQREISMIGFIVAPEVAYRNLAQ